MINKETIAQLFRNYYPDMLRLARLLLHDGAESEDVVDEIFAALMHKDIVPTGSTIRPFLMTAVRNRCLNILRNRSIQQRVQGLYLLDSQLDTASADDIEERITHMKQAIDSSLDDKSARQPSTSASERRWTHSGRNSQKTDRPWTRLNNSSQ